MVKRQMAREVVFHFSSWLSRFAVEAVGTNGTSPIKMRSWRFHRGKIWSPLWSARVGDETAAHIGGDGVLGIG